MEKVGSSWAWALFFGFFTLVIGVLVVVWPQETLKVLAVLFGLQLLVMGIYSLARGLGAGEQHRVWSIFLGLFSIIVAIIVFRNVGETVVILTLILGIYWVIQGILQFVMAVSDKTYEARGYTIFMGILSVIAGIVVVAWPIESVTVLAWITGIWLIILGILGMILALAIRAAGSKPDKMAVA